MEPYAGHSDVHGQNSDPSLSFHQALRLCGDLNASGPGDAVRRPSEGPMPSYAGEALFTRQGQQIRGSGDVVPAWNTSSHPPLGKHSWAKKATNILSFAIIGPTSHFVDPATGVSRDTSLSVDIPSASFNLNTLPSSSTSWSPVSTQIDEGVVKSVPGHTFHEEISSKTSQYASFPSHPCFPLVGLTGKTNGLNLRAEYRTTEPELTPGHVFSCIEVCDQPSCIDGCQKDHGESGYICSNFDSTVCYGPDVCERTTCDGSSLLDAPPVCLDDGCPFTFLDRDGSFDNDRVPVNLEPALSTLDMTGQSLQCRWELPDVQCDVSLPSANALGQHIFQDHIQPLATSFPWEQTNVLRQEQQPPEYLCQWGSCRRTFSDHAALERHVKVAHTNLDCRWAGCEVSRESPALLKTHVNMDHLNISQDTSWQPYPYGFSPAFAQPPYSGADGAPANKQESIFECDGSFQAATSQRVVADPNNPQNGLHENPQRSPYSPSNSVHPPTGNGSQQITWPISPVVRAARSSNSLASSCSNLQGASQPQHPSSVMGSFRTTPAKNNNVHTCQWLVDQSLGKICGATFTDANILQTHVNEEHTTSFSLDGILCHWKDCKRNRGPKPTFPNKEKLKRHMYTHTGCKCYLILSESN